MVYRRVSWCWVIAKFSIAIGITCLNKVACYSHVWTHTEGSSKLIIVITSHQMDVSNFGSWPNSRKYSEKDANEMNLYPMANHGNCKSQFQVWPFWSPYFRNPHFTVCTIHLANPFALRWYREVVWWCINVFSHKSWKSLRNFIPWSMRTSVGTPNLLNILSKNAHVAPSLLRFS